MKSNKEIPFTKTTDDPVFKQYGPPFLTDGSKVVLNDRAVAIKCAEMHMIKYDTDAKRYERFDSKRGLWVFVSETAVAGALDKLISQVRIMTSRW